MRFMLIHVLTILMIIAWFVALGSLELPHVLYENPFTKKYLPSYNSFRIKCNAVNEFRKSTFNSQSAEGAMNFESLLNIVEPAENGINQSEEKDGEQDGEDTKPEVFPEEMTTIKELFTKYSFSDWALEDDFGYVYRECLTKELKDCTYPYWDMYGLSFAMGVLYVLGILNIILNFPFIGKRIRIMPYGRIFTIVLRYLGLLTDEQDLPFFSVFIVVMVSIYWGAYANRFKDDCQSVIDAKEGWYDNVPTYAIVGSLLLMLIQFQMAKRETAQLEKLIKNEMKNIRIQGKKEKENKSRAFNVGKNPTAADVNSTNNPIQ